MAKKFLIIGAGVFGSALAQELHRHKHEVVAMDSDEKALDKLEGALVYGVVGDGKETPVLEEVGIQGFDAVVVAIGDAFEASILITKRLQDGGAKKIICKASNQQMGEILLAVGADEVVYPEKEAGVKTARHLSYSGILEYIDINEEVSGIEVEVPEAFFGKSLSELNFSKKYGLTVALMLREGKPLLYNMAQVAFQKGDCFLVVGENKKIDQFKHKFL